MKSQKIINSFNAAIEGFLYVIKTQRNMRIHFLIALLVLLCGIYFNFTRIELMILCFTIGLVLITEMINTAVEIVLDRVSGSYAHWVRTVKDICAGSVLVASINAIIVGYFLFFNEIVFRELKKGMAKVSKSDWHISFFILIILLGLVIAGKTIFQKGKPLRGGMPSGHSAVAFSVWTLVALMSQNPLLVFAVFILAFMVAQSRIGRHFHTFWEALTGAAIGIITTVMIYRLLTG